MTGNDNFGGGRYGSEIVVPATGDTTNDNLPANANLKGSSRDTTRDHDNSTQIVDGMDREDALARGWAAVRALTQLGCGRTAGELAEALHWLTKHR